MQNKTLNRIEAAILYQLRWIYYEIRWQLILFFVSNEERERMLADEEEINHWIAVVAEREKETARKDLAAGRHCCPNDEINGGFVDVCRLCPPKIRM